MDRQRLLSYVRKAIDTYHMIQPNDTIAIGVSGGKDSLSLLVALACLRRFYPIPFSIHAISVHLGLPGLSFAPVAAFCESLQVPYTVIPTEIGPILFEERKEKNPCSLCAKMRKGVFNQKAKELGCNKVAYAHHKEDLIETMLLSLIFEGRFYCFPPITYLDRIDLTVIRPLLYVREADIRSFQQKEQLPVQKNPCPVDGFTKREYVKQLIKQLDHTHRNTSERLFHALSHGNIPGWPKTDLDTI